MSGVPLISYTRLHWVQTHSTALYLPSLGRAASQPYARVGRHPPSAVRSSEERALVPRTAPPHACSPATRMPDPRPLNPSDALPPRMRIRRAEFATVATSHPPTSTPQGRDRQPHSADIILLVPKARLSIHTSVPTTSSPPSSSHATSTRHLRLLLKVRFGRGSSESVTLRPVATWRCDQTA